MFCNVLWYASQHDKAVWRFLKAYFYNNITHDNKKKLDTIFYNLID